VKGGQRQKVLLGILAAIVLLAVWMVWPSSDDAAPPVGVNAPGGAASPDEEGGAPSLPARPRPTARRTRTEVPSDRVLPLRLADLQRTPRDSTPGRDPWRFVLPPPPPAPKPPPGPSAADLARIRAEQERLRLQQEAEAARLAAEAAIPKPPPFPYRYLGNFGPVRMRIAAFTDGKSEFNVREGERIGNDFILQHIGYESVDIKYVNFPDTPALRVPVGR
jgi:hypothetical protein